VTREASAARREIGRETPPSVVFCEMSVNYNENRLDFIVTWYYFNVMLCNIERKYEKKKCINVANC
jgi:hypothetical protein